MQTPLPLHERRFTLDDELVDIYSFLDSNCDGDAQAWKFLKDEIMQLAPSYTMYFGGGAVPARALRRIK